MQAYAELLHIRPNYLSKTAKIGPLLKEMLESHRPDNTDCPVSYDARARFPAVDLHEVLTNLEQRGVSNKNEMNEVTEQSPVFTVENTSTLSLICIFHMEITNARMMCGALATKAAEQELPA